MVAIIINVKSTRLYVETWVINSHVASRLAVFVRGVFLVLLYSLAGFLCIFRYGIVSRLTVFLSGVFFTHVVATRLTVFLGGVFFYARCCYTSHGICQLCIFYAQLSLVSSRRNFDVMCYRSRDY